MLHEKDLMGMFEKQLLINKFLLEETYSSGKCRGYHAIFKFPNSYGASVIYHEGSYGFYDDKFELAVLKFNGDDWNLCYSTEITSDVEGYLSKSEVIDLLVRIKQLD